MAKIHYFDIVHDRKIPEWDENKEKGYKASMCGYQRKETTLLENKVTCKLCIIELNKRGVKPKWEG